MDGDGVVDFRELVVGLSTLRSEQPTRESLQTLFRLYDLDDSGDISRYEFGMMLNALAGPSENLENPLEPAQLAERFVDIFELIDANGDDAITFDEFVGAIEREPNLLHQLTSRTRHISDTGGNPASLVAAAAAAPLTLAATTAGQVAMEEG